MYGILTYIILGLLSLFCVGEQCKNRVNVPESVIQQLFDLVLDNQVHTEAHSSCGSGKIPSKGSYKCVMKFNRFGDAYQTALRWTININDINSLIPMWVSIVLLEAHRYGAAPRPSDEQLMSTIDFCSGFADSTKPYNNSLMLFWKCIFDETNQRCTTRPLAYMELMKLVEAATNGNPVMHQTMDMRKLQTVLKTFNELIHILTGAENFGNIFLSVLQEIENFQFVTDADDTSVWIGLGSLLQAFDDEFLPVFNKWIQYNSNIASFFNAVKEFAYRPFSSDPVASTIDPKSYFVLRHFLDDAKSAGKNVALVTTWFTNVNKVQSNGRSINSPIPINNVELTICANVVNAITSSILSGLVSPEMLRDPELHDVYQSTSEMISYLIKSNFSNRQDLAFPYYLSPHQFYWITSKAVFVMDIYKRKSPLPLDVMDVVYNNLRQALEGEATRFLISSVKQNKDDGSLYFDDFLGNGDVTDDNKPITRGEDRIFTTAMAANALMYTWLSFDPDSTLSQWRSNTPDAVKKTVDGCILWLVNHALGGQFKPWNALFAFQNKGIHDLPLQFPSNIIVDFPQQYPFQYVSYIPIHFGVQGYIPKSDYETMMNTSSYGRPSTTFNGFNDPVYNEMLFWSSDPYTYAATLLALSRYRTMTTTDENDCNN